LKAEKLASLEAWKQGGNVEAFPKSEI